MKVQLFGVDCTLRHYTKCTCGFDAVIFLRQRSEEVAFYRGVLKDFEPGNLILGVGANEGHKVAVFLAMGDRVVCVEPDLRNIAHLRNRFRW